MKITEVPRNDIDAARAYYEEHAPLEPEEVEMLLMLQNDVWTLIHVMESERWRVKPGRV